MKHVFNWKKTLAALCVLALLVSVLPASVLAEEMVEIPESDYIYVNEDSRIVTAQEEMSLLRLTVETAGKFHVLASGVDIKLVLFDETAGTVRDTYASENGLMDVPFYAAPGMYLLGIIGSGEVAIRVTDETETEKIYSSEVVAETPAEKAADETTEETTEEVPAVEPAAEPVVEEPAFDPSVPIAYKGVIGETVSVLAILQEAGASVEAVTYVSGNVDGLMVSSADSVNLGNWLLTPCGYFDSVTLIVKTVEDIDYTLVVSCPAPVEEVEPAEAPAEVADEQPADTTTEVVDEQPAETTAEVVDEQPADTTAEVADEQPADTTAEVADEQSAENTEDAPEVVDQPAEPEKEEKGFLAGFVDWLTGNSSKKTTEEEAEPAEDDEEADEPVDETTADESADEASDEAEDIKEVEETEEPAEAPAEESEEEPSEEPETEEPADVTEPSEEALSEVSIDAETPISYQITNNEQITLLPILTEAGVPVNTITSVTGEVDGKVILADQGNGDWVITPYAYFDSLELTVTATDYLAEDSAEAETVYTVILTNPDPDAAPAQEAEPAEEVEEEAAEEEVTEATEEEKETEESSDESLLTTNYSLPIDSVTIDVERQEDNAVRLFAEDIGEEDAEAYAYQWQYSLDGEEWFDVEGATEKDYNFKLDETNGSYYWRLVVSYT